MTRYKLQAMLTFCRHPSLFLLKMQATPPEPRGKWLGDNVHNAQLRVALRHAMDRLIAEALRRRGLYI